MADQQVKVVQKELEFSDGNGLRSIPESQKEVEAKEKANDQNPKCIVFADGRRKFEKRWRPKSR